MKKLVVLLFVTLVALSAFACTIVAVGKDAMEDGSTVITHNDDSTSADFRLWTIPAKDWEEGATRDIVVDSHNYNDFGNFPESVVYEKGTVMAQIPQVPHTYSYFHSRYSFMNEMGVAMGESTFSVDTSTEYGKKVNEVMVRNSWGIVDCWAAQDIALERAATAREAVQIMGDLIEEYGWYGSGETINVCDGNEVWIAEFYGNDVWVAVKIPDDHFFVAANRARILDYDPDDTENYMASPNIISFAVDQGWYDPESGEPFEVAKIYAPNDNIYATRREWRAFDLVAPSLELSPQALRFPLSVKPEQKLTVKDVWDIKADYYQGTDYDLTVGPAAGPWGDPIRYANRGAGTWERSINMHRTCYVHIANVKAWLPEGVKALSWFGYGAPDTSYIVPLWPIVHESGQTLPDFYETGSRYEEFRTDSGWWVNTYVQQMTELRYVEAIEDVRAFRDPKEEMLFTVTPLVQEEAAKIYETDPQAAINLINEYSYQNALAFHEEWIDLGNWLLGNYAMGYRNFSTTGFPEWWNEFIGYGYPER